MEMQLAGIPQTIINNVQGVEAIDVTSGNVTLSASQAQKGLLIFTGTPGVSRDVTYPVGSTPPAICWAYSASNGNIVLKYAGGGATTTIAVATDTSAAYFVNAALGAVDMRW